MINDISGAAFLGVGFIVVLGILWLLIGWPSLPGPKLPEPSVSPSDRLPPPFRKEASTPQGPTGSWELIPGSVLREDATHVEPQRTAWEKRRSILRIEGVDPDNSEAVERYYYDNARGGGIV